MAHYVDSLNALNGFCCGYIPGREPICLSLALVGIICLAAAMAIVLRTGEEPGAVLLND
ncbi:MAG: hypothetical protein HY553_09610 [Elusimicrobia bacterium]|nr:hypothetical protein [Elusimicrobiota bacterium]